MQNKTDQIKHTHQPKWKNKWSLKYLRCSATVFKIVTKKRKTKGQLKAFAYLIFSFFLKKRFFYQQNRGLTWGFKIENKIALNDLKIGISYKKVSNLNIFTYQLIKNARFD